MQIKNAKVFRNRKFEAGSVSFTERFEAQAPGEVLDAEGAYLIPGLIDIHTHGAMGVDASDCSADEIPRLGEYYASHGVTSFCFTTLTAPRENLISAMKNIRLYTPRGLMAKCAGVHLEGPFLSYEKRGAQAPENLMKPDFEFFSLLNELSGNAVRLITVAPELEGALPFIRRASELCTVSLGHSTADYAAAMAGFEAGASHVTHLFNGMQPFHHRKPGLIGAALDAGATVELICDGLHIDPTVIRAVHRLFGEKLVIISDSLRCAGLSDGHYDLAGLPIVVKNGRATLLDGTLAGSSTNLLSELRLLRSFGLPLEDIVYSMTEAPARVLGIFRDRGSADIGKAADFILLNEELQLKAVFIDGKKVL